MITQGEIDKYIKEIHEEKDTFKAAYKASIIPRTRVGSLGNKIVNESEQVIGEQIDNTAKNYLNRLKVCQDHLTDIKKLALDFYDEFIDRENRLLIAFIKYKLS